MTKPRSTAWKALAVGVLACAARPWSAGVAPRDETMAALVEHDARTGRPYDNVDELLPALPAELRGHFTLVHESRSPHGGLGDRAFASVGARFPRLLLFRDDARVVLALNGDPDRPGYDVVEAIHFSDERAAFELTRFVLPAAVRRDPSLARESARNGEINPPECLHCHGVDPRPLYDAYPSWPGFYGSVLDTFPAGSPDLPRYREFLAGEARRGVYRHLLWPPSSPVPPYLDPEEYDPEEVAGSYDALARAPNTRLGMALGELNRKRIARKLAASPAYPRYRHALLAVLLGCAAPPLTQEDHVTVRRALGAERAAKERRLGFTPRGPRGSPLMSGEASAPGNVAQVLYVARVLGVDPHDFSLALEGGALASYDGLLGSEHEGRSYYLKEDLILELLRRLAGDEPQFARHFATFQVFGADHGFGERLDLRRATGACADLLARQQALGAELPALPAGALLAAAGTPPVIEEAATAREPAVLDRCVRCHEGEDGERIGRPIPLSSPEHLRTRLGATAASAMRPLRDEILARVHPGALAPMPPHGRRLTDAEVTVLERYLDTVAAGALAVAGRTP